MVMSGNGVKSLLERASEAAKKIRESIKRGDHIRIESHLDADGLSSASILISALRKLKWDYEYIILAQLSEQKVRELSKNKETILIFTDLGSGSFSIISKYLS